MSASAADDEADLVREDTLLVGDHISVAITHEVNFPGGDKAWIRYGVITQRQAGETQAQAEDRADLSVQAGSMKVIASTYKTIQQAASSTPDQGGY